MEHEKHTCSECGCGIGRFINAASCEDAHDTLCNNCFHMEDEVDPRNPHREDSESSLAVDNFPGGNIAGMHEKSIGLWDDLEEY